MDYKTISFLTLLFLIPFLLIAGLPFSYAAGPNPQLPNCYATPNCDKKCNPAYESCFEDISHCGDFFPFSCVPYTIKPKGQNVDIGRDFLIGLASWKNLSSYSQCYGTLSGFISCFLPTIYIVAGVILLFLLIGGGFAIMMSTNDPQKKGQGSKAITAAIIGFLVLFTSYWIVQLIQKLTGVPIFDTSKIVY